MCQMTSQLDVTETYDLSIYKNLREEVKTKWRQQWWLLILL
jgi:hypothetical protein